MWLWITVFCVFTAEWVAAFEEKCCALSHGGAKYNMHFFYIYIFFLTSELPSLFDTLLYFLQMLECDWSVHEGVLYFFFLYQMLVTSLSLIRNWCINNNNLWPLTPRTCSNVWFGDGDDVWRLLKTLRCLRAASREDGLNSFVCFSPSAPHLTFFFFFLIALQSPSFPYQCEWRDC